MTCVCCRPTIDQQDGRTALHWAGSGSNLGVTQLLLSYSPDLEARDTMGWTPLMVAGELLKMCYCSI